MTENKSKSWFCSWEIFTNSSHFYGLLTIRLHLSGLHQSIRWTFIFCWGSSYQTIFKHPINWIEKRVPRIDSWFKEDYFGCNINLTQSGSYSCMYKRKNFSPAIPLNFDACHKTVRSYQLLTSTLERLNKNYKPSSYRNWFWENSLAGYFSRTNTQKVKEVTRYFRYVRSLSKWMLH